MTQFPLPYPDGPSTLSVLNAVIDLMKSTFLSVQINGANAYKYIGLGGLKDVTAAVPAGIVTLNNAPSKRYASGGKMQNQLHLNIDSYADYTHALDAEQWIAQVYDMQVALFLGNATLHGAPGVSYVTLSDQVPTFGFITQGVPLPLRVLRIGVTAYQMYNLQVVR